MTRDENYQKAAAALGYSFDGEIKSGGNYAPLVRDGNVIYVSGQVPRVGSELVVSGRAGAEVSLAQAQLGAKICVLRALALLQRSLGSLDHIRSVNRVTVFVQSSPDFTQQSEVADGGSDLLVSILGSVGAHTRTSVGVYQLPKNATVELDFIFGVDQVGKT